MSIILQARRRAKTTTEESRVGVSGLSHKSLPKVQQGGKAALPSFPGSQALKANSPLAILCHRGYETCHRQDEIHPVSLKQGERCQVLEKVQFDCMRKAGCGALG